MKLFTVFFVLLVVVMLVGDSGGNSEMPLRVSHRHQTRDQATKTNKNKTEALRTIHPHEGDSVLSSIVEDGARRGFEECQKLFYKNTARPWNCPLEMYKKLPIFSNTTFPYATKHSGLIHAINAAAIAYEIAHQCTQNKIPGCGCPKPPKKFNGRRVWTWAWGGCGDNIEFGVKKSKRFTDRLETRNDAVGAVNLYNNKVGREVVRTSARLQCKCHRFWHRECGFKTCWMELAPFEYIASKLKEKYEYARQVWFLDNKLRVLYGNGESRSLSRYARRRREKPLVFLDFVPLFCVRNDTLGYPGMLGHTCDSNASPDKCELFTAMCNHGCKLRVKIVESYDKTVKCRCKFGGFHNCKLCTTTYSVMTCSEKSPITAL
ncbi:protein Wnt-8a-like [Oculina patagonica]